MTAASGAGESGLEWIGGAAYFDRAHLPRLLNRFLAVALLWLPAVSACDSTTPTPDETAPGAVDLTATFSLRGSGADVDLAQLTGTAEPLDVSDAWTVETDGARTFVSVDVEIGDGPTRGVPFVITAERCPGRRAVYDFAVYPAPGAGDPLWASGGTATAVSEGLGCEGGTLSVFYIKGFGGVPGDARVFLDGLDSGPDFTTDLSTYGLAGSPGIVFDDDGSSWPAPGGRSALHRCYEVEPSANDSRALTPLTVRRTGDGFWDLSAYDGCSTIYFQGVGYLSYVFALDESAFAEVDP